jgi:hypothetical protein
MVVEQNVSFVSMIYLRYKVNLNSYILIFLAWQLPDLITHTDKIDFFALIDNREYLCTLISGL